MNAHNILNLRRNLKINVNLSSFSVALVHDKHKLFPLLKISEGFSDTPEVVALGWRDNLTTLRVPRVKKSLYCPCLPGSAAHGERNTPGVPLIVPASAAHPPSQPRPWGLSRTTSFLPGQENM